MTIEQALEKATVLSKANYWAMNKNSLRQIAAELMHAYADGMQEVFSSREMRFDEVKIIRAKADELENKCKE